MPAGEGIQCVINHIQAELKLTGIIEGLFSILLLMHRVDESE